ncbi:hypothetical protein A3F34_00835 [Candidatus Roizmanbacteria bacterium RIFCSPHIGHO2_12_FULL_44_10]|uniref:Polymerase nucleotidyl transferase domain-containing protein n=1 Tax=Candidatus Roizmanbacteria bacterium RIFCSPHIGHO2_12_FULL_44_10 TaxID=1802054 RepID=A0A1F7I818_9BACT|nr:MAG: hypothetical protein A3F34_00835 [Candidatus Roizmanbacteria bacterium RIFCSPHIGHO2_12_FULL_44_10]
MDNRPLEQAIIETLSYFVYFGFAPSFVEIYCYISIKTSKKRLEKVLGSMEGKKLLVSGQDKLNNESVYTLRGHRMSINNRHIRKGQTEKELKKLQKFIKLLAKFPQIQLIGISGSCAMGNAETKDDVDFFIITAPKRMWTGRVIGLFIANVMGARRKRGQVTVRDLACLNMFFDGRNISVPKYKRNLYTAHEVVQMKPVFSHHAEAQKFLQKNRWISHYFPNYTIPTSRYQSVGNQNRLVGDVLEWLFRKIQLALINRHKTREIVTETQLWFFPNDFEMQIKGRL